MEGGRRRQACARTRKTSHSTHASPGVSIGRPAHATLAPPPHARTTHTAPTPPHAVAMTPRMHTVRSSSPHATPPRPDPPTALPPPSVSFVGLSTSSKQKPAGTLQATSTPCVPLLPILLKHGLVIHVLVFPALLLQPLDQRILLGNVGTTGALTRNARRRRDGRSVWTPPHKTSPRRGARKGEGGGKAQRWRAGRTRGGGEGTKVGTQRAKKNEHRRTPVSTGNRKETIDGGTRQAGGQVRQSRRPAAAAAAAVWRPHGRVRGSSRGSGGLESGGPKEGGSPHTPPTYSDGRDVASSTAAAAAAAVAAARPGRAVMTGVAGGRAAVAARAGRGADTNAMVGGGGGGEGRGRGREGGDEG